jgi:hypothetical protein
MKKGGAIERGKYALQRMIPTKHIQSQLHRRVFQEFADKIGLVYFGYVDQRNDEHSLIRGLTVSTKHRDNHYCIGSFESYDITLVERIDTIHVPGKPSRTHNWIIMTLDLHRAVDLPHIFVGPHTHSDAFYAQLFTKYGNFNKVPLELSGTYDSHFLKRYTVFTKAEQALSAERVFSPAITKIISDKFDGLAIELSEGTIYLYAENQRPSSALLDKMLTRGMWLAKQFDQ